MHRSGAAETALQPSWILHSMGAVGLVLAAVHALTDPHLSAWLESVLVAAIAGTLIYSGYDTTRRDLSAENEWHVVELTAYGIVTYMAVAAAVIVLFALEATLTPKFPYLLLLAGVLGGAMTARAGLYAATSREELARAEELTKLLKISQRVLRHNLRNELAIALGHLDNIEHDQGTTQDTARIRKHLNELIETGDDARTLVSIYEKDKRTEFDLATVVEDAVPDVRSSHPRATISTDAPHSCPVSAHLMLPEAVSEAVTNAVEHTSPDCEVRISVSECDGWAELRVADTGPGIPELERRAILEGEDALAHSRGLGLWLIYWVVEKSGGDFDITDRDPTGTVVRLRLPAKRAD